MPLHLSSPRFDHRGEMPASLTCEGANTSPALAWTGAPPGTRGFALILDDPDAPDPRAPQRVFVHWVLYDIPATIASLPEAAVPSGIRMGKNDHDRASYTGPCPPIGRHRYFFKLFALDTLLGDLQMPTKTRLEAAMAGHILAKTELLGTYKKKFR